MQSLLVILGPTAVGKTALSLSLAQKLNGEIISADSRLFYRGMDIGTAKPTPAEQASVPHYLIDICEPDETLSLGAFQRLAYQTIDAVLAKGKLPILVGGTGQYVSAIVEGWGIPEVIPQPALRAALEAMGGPEMARWLQYLDPVIAKKHDPRNLRRIVRALEVTLVAGVPISMLQKKSPPPYQICMVGLQRERKLLYARVDKRVDLMMAAGLLAELEGLRDAGYGRSLPSMTGHGYRQLWAYLAHEMTLDAAVERIKIDTHRLVRHQNNWFGRQSLGVEWFDAGDAGLETAVYKYINQMV